jgi:hypothetical protein
MHRGVLVSNTLCLGLLFACQGATGKAAQVAKDVLAAKRGKPEAARCPVCDTAVGDPQNLAECNSVHHIGDNLLLSGAHSRYSRGCQLLPLRLLDFGSTSQLVA